MRTRFVVYGAVALLVIVAAVVAVLYVRKESFNRASAHITSGPPLDRPIRSSDNYIPPPPHVVDPGCLSQCKGTFLSCVDACPGGTECLNNCSTAGFECASGCSHTSMYAGAAPYPHMEAGPSYVLV